jgi:ATP-dependent DNA helicase RecG
MPIELSTPVTYLKGVGPRRAEALRRLDIVTAGDLLYHLPHRYEDASTVSPISSLEPGMDATVLGRVISKGVIPTRKGLRVFQAVVRDASGIIEASWPGQPFLDRTISRDDVLLLSGPVRFFHGRQLQPREYVNMGRADEEGLDGGMGGRVLSVYPATEGLSFRQIRSLLDAHLDTLLPLVRELLPDELLRRAAVPPLPEALRMVHRPTSVAEAMRGRERIAMEELLFFHVLQYRAKALARERRDGIVFANRRELTSRLKESLPYELTAAQIRSTREIVTDMCSEYRMHRLLQGDVGSGKTIVALFAALLAVENGYQAAIMVPTELLAEQHARTFTQLLDPLGVRTLLVTGGMPARERRAAAETLESGAPLVAVGTHALVQSGTRFGKLGFVAIDEQHRFGVEQRSILGAKGGGVAGTMPDVLLMSATPIPRSLALTLHGDLDVSVLDERPVGRLPIRTALRRGSARERVMQFIDGEIERGRQAYVVYPVIEETEKLDLKAATTMFEELASGVFAHRRVALLHGRLSAEERDATMRAFRDHEIDILVSTTVIEVGIDVANATVMLIEHPERFGLSQLHQLRGRVGRGAEESYCILLGDAAPDSAQRLEVFVKTEDGFEIARADLELRGMGDLFGERQSGMPTFKVANPLHDERLMLLTRELASDMLARDPELTSPEHAGIRRALTERYSRALELFRVG